MSVCVSDLFTRHLIDCRKLCRRRDRSFADGVDDVSIGSRSYRRFV